MDNQSHRIYWENGEKICERGKRFKGGLKSKDGQGGGIAKELILPS